MLNDLLHSENRSPGPDYGWYALYTRHHHEKVVARSLMAKGFKVFLPLYSAQRIWKDRTKVIALPLFTCYVFIQTGLKHHLDIVTTAGIHDFVRSAGFPAMIPPREIDGILKVVEHYVKIEPHPFIRCGDRVRVNAGPLEGIEGILLRKKNFSRLVLSVELLGQSASVDIDVAMVERVSNPNKPCMPIKPGSDHAGYVRTM